MLEHKLLFWLMVLAALASMSWVLIIYVLSYHSARRLVDAIDPSNVPRQAVFGHGFSAGSARATAAPGGRPSKSELCT